MDAGIREEIFLLYQTTLPVTGFSKYSLPRGESCGRRRSLSSNRPRGLNFDFGGPMTDYERFGEYQASEQPSGSGLGLGITMLLIGLGAGALTALLLAPRSGRQTRRMLRRKYEDAVETINERADEWKERGAGWAETARGWVGSAKDAAENVSERVRPMVKEARKK